MFTGVALPTTSVVSPAWFHARDARAFFSHDGSSLHTIWRIATTTTQETHLRCELPTKEFCCCCSQAPSE